MHSNTHIHTHGICTHTRRLTHRHIETETRRHTPTHGHTHTHTHARTHIHERTSSTVDCVCGHSGNSLCHFCRSLTQVQNHVTCACMAQGPDTSGDSAKGCQPQLRWGGTAQRSIARGDEDAPKKRAGWPGQLTIRSRVGTSGAWKEIIGSGGGQRLKGLYR